MRSVLLGLVGLAAGCVTNVDLELDGVSPAVTPGLDDDFANAAQRHGVPVDLLKAIGHVETRWQNIASEGHDGPAAYGVMALGGDRLARAEDLAGVDDASEEVTANLEAAAALLAAAGTGASDLASWRAAVEEYAGIADVEARSDYADAVYRVLARGAHEVAESGEVIAHIDPHPEIPEPGGGSVFAAGPDYAAAIWRASPNYSSRPSGTAPAMIIIHTCEGAYAGCWGWLRNSSSGVSAHYVVKEDGSEVTQLVREASKAWHISATYACSRNGNTDCFRDGQGSNNFTIGIEHAGFESQASFPPGQIEASARLSCDISRDNNIPRDRNHIVGHGQLQPWNRTDPGPRWPWAHYIDRIRFYCEGGDTTPDPDGPGPLDLIVDSNNANNDASKARIALGTSWTSASATPGYYGTGYWYGATDATDDAASFQFFAPAAGTHTVEAWWTAGTNRSTATQFVAFNSAGTEVGRVQVNQSTSGSQWVTLGTWTFQAGWNRVDLRRRGTTGKVVIADAIRVR